MSEESKLLGNIAFLLTRIDRNDLTTAEHHIVQLLEEAGYLKEIEDEDNNHYETTEKGRWR